jgi:concanavalin A-like lectin/glucanase superfamily protein
VIAMRLKVPCVVALGWAILMLTGCGDSGDSGAPAQRDDGVPITIQANNIGVLPDTGNPDGDRGTITFAVRPEWDGNDAEYDNVLDIRTPNVWENRLGVVKDGEYLRLTVWPDSGVDRSVAMRIDSWMAGQQHRIAVVWAPDDSANGDAPVPGVASLYVDGVLVSSSAYDSPLELRPGTRVGVGPGGPEPEAGRNALVSNLRIFGRPLSSQEVAATADQ